MGVGSWGIGASNFSIGRTNSSTGTSSALTILANGNIGIDDTTPSYKLDVNGDINLTGDIRSNGTIWDPTPVITANQIAYGTGTGI